MILRNHLNGKFTQLPNEMIEDLSISPMAYRIASYLFSRPDKWVVRRSDVMAKMGIKDTHTFAKKLKELDNAGWCRKIRARKQDGTFGDYEYHLFAEKTPKDLSVKKPHVGERPKCEKTPRREKPNVGATHTLNNTDTNINTNININTEKSTSQFEVKKNLLKISPQDSIENRMAAWKIYNSFSETEDFRNQWEFLADTIKTKKVAPKKVLKAWVTGADWYLVRNMRINKMKNWIAKESQIQESAPKKMRDDDAQKEAQKIAIKNLLSNT